MLAKDSNDSFLLPNPQASFHETCSGATLGCPHRTSLGPRTTDHLSSKTQHVTLCSNILLECPLFTAYVLKTSTIFLKSKEKLKQADTFATDNS